MALLPARRHERVDAVFEPEHAARRPGVRPRGREVVHDVVRASTRAESMDRPWRDEHERGGPRTGALRYVDDRRNGRRGPFVEDGVRLVEPLDERVLEVADRLRERRDERTDAGAEGDRRVEAAQAQDRDGLAQLVRHVAEPEAMKLPGAGPVDGQQTSPRGLWP